MLVDLYIGQDKSLNDIAKELGGMTFTTVRNKLLRLGIQLKKRGGAQNVLSRPIDISQEEYESSSYKEMALRHTCSLSTIYQRTRVYPRKKLRISPLGPQDRDDPEGS